ncbi:MAG TPA: arsenate reductase (glutaredoxin) [Oleiagrimonas sp.]|nr:arsenate reductase (glutaredoxin) [Oleiagrimonas sp.]HET7663521.1 arsenate reductase (glutaredoxin) [Rhodanobacteraceae bacterium]HET8553435.1 arsenate reductase (glutaredoxin) [Rhodanobacteraceae bacterium]
MSAVRIYHNPRCSKSRATLELLAERGIEPEVIKYLDTPPDADELDRILRLLKLEPRQLMRPTEAEYTELNLSDNSLTRKQLIDAMVEHPRLIQRPIVLANGKASLGRPPEAVLDIL